jgi:hypothetical protein
MKRATIYELTKNFLKIDFFDLVPVKAEMSKKRNSLSGMSQ